MDPRRRDAGLRLRHRWLLARSRAAASEVEEAVYELAAVRREMAITGRIHGI